MVEAACYLPALATFTGRVFAAYRAMPSSAGDVRVMTGKVRGLNSCIRNAGVSTVHCIHMRVLGIDCGGEYTGYGVVEMHSGGRLCCLTCGAIKLSPREPLPRRLSRIFTQLGEIIVEHRPDQVAIEDVFYAVNVRSALKLGHVRGVAMLAASSHKIFVSEYAPLTIKSAVVGYGKAEKAQVQLMVARLLGLEEIPEPADAADALAIAICDLHTASSLTRQQAAAK